MPLKPDGSLCITGALGRSPQEGSRAGSLLCNRKPLKPKTKAGRLRAEEQEVRNMGGDRPTRRLRRGDEPWGPFFFSSYSPFSRCCGSATTSLNGRSQKLEAKAGRTRETKPGSHGEGSFQGGASAKAARHSHIIRLMAVGWKEVGREKRWQGQPPHPQHHPLVRWPSLCFPEREAESEGQGRRGLLGHLEEAGTGAEGGEAKANASARGRSGRRFWSRRGEEERERSSLEAVAMGAGAAADAGSEDFGQEPKRRAVRHGARAVEGSTA